MITPIPTSLPQTPLPTVEEQEQIINSKRKREEEEMGCEPPQQTTIIPHSPSPHFQFHPTTPEKPTPYSTNPNLLQRMQGDTCFYCGQQGHWAPFCPLKTPNNNNHSPVMSSDKKIWCPCGHGVCDVKTARTAKNYGREFFACPIERGEPCDKFKWCDATIDENDLRRPLITYPVCQCRAGVCRKVKEGGNNSYFICPIRQGFGSCGYRVSEVELPNNASNDEQLNNTSIDNDLTNGLAEGSELLLTTKRMRITDNSENSSPLAVFEFPEGGSGGSPIEEANSQHAGFPEIELEDDLKSINLASWEAMEAEALSRMSTQSMISCRQSLFEMDIGSADASFGIFPSFDPIDVPKKASTQLSTDVVSPNRSPGSESKLKAQIQRDAVIYTQKRLLNDLKKSDFHQHESMRETAEATFSTLNLLGFECKQFSDYVWDFINLATSTAEIDKSMENSPTLEEHNKFLEEEKVRLANIRDDCVKTETLLAVSDEKRNLLSEEVAHLQALLLKKRNELEICELEKMKLESQLDNMKRRMLKVDLTVKDKARQAEVARQKNVERDTKQIAARTALEKAKHALEN